MFKKYLTVILTILILNLSLCVSVFAETKEAKDAKLAEKVRTNIIKLGTGKEARVEVKLKDGRKIKGFISEVKRDSFVVMNEKTGTPIEVSYPQTKQIKGNNLSTGAKIAIGIAIGFAIAVLLIFNASRTP